MSHHTSVDVLPLRTTYTPSAAVQVETRGVYAPAELAVWHLGDLVRSVPAAASGVHDLGPLPAGGYGVEVVVAGEVVARTAVEVRANDRERLRYGFVASYAPDREIEGVVDNVRRLHLNGIQFYDWAYRHADLVGGGEDYLDPLGQPVSLATARRLVQALRRVGSDALGYAAVYGVGSEEWERWRHARLEHSDGTTYALGDFLRLVDPADPAWLDHLGKDLTAAIETVGFAGFHLDQYGYPRRAGRPDGTTVDLARSFTAMIHGVRRAVPQARLVFNNVNDFPTWATAAAPQDAVYIEAWEPHTTLAALASTVTRARAAGDGKPVVVAAYQHVYDTAPPAAADLATSFTMATLFSHGATQLLAGEADRILVDPYYVRNHAVEPGTASLLRRWYDFLVEHDELLMDPGIVDVSGAWLGSYNDALDVTYPEALTSDVPKPGTVWRRLVQAGDRLVLHVVNLLGQHDTLWDGPRQTPESPGTGTLRIRRAGRGLPVVRTADPDGGPRLIPVPVHADGDVAVAELPEPHVWQMAVIDL